MFYRKNSERGKKPLSTSYCLSRSQCAINVGQLHKEVENEDPGSFRFLPRNAIVPGSEVDVCRIFTRGKKCEGGYDAIRTSRTSSFSRLVRPIKN